MVHRLPVQQAGELKWKSVCYVPSSYAALFPKPHVLFISVL